MFKAMIIAGLGGFIGTCLRFLTGKFFHAVTSSAFPWGTFSVNVIGSFVIGIFFGLAERSNVISPSMNVFLITGFCGGFTTFSTFANENYLLFQSSQFPVALLYAGVSNGIPPVGRRIRTYCIYKKCLMCVVFISSISSFSLIHLAICRIDRLTVDIVKHQGIVLCIHDTDFFPRIRETHIGVKCYRSFTLFS